jgi:hypothetical protein
MKNDRTIRIIAATLVLASITGIGSVTVAASVTPTEIDQPNFKLTDPPANCPVEYKFDSIGSSSLPWIPLADGGPAVYTWPDVQSCDGTTSGPVTVKLWIYTVDGQQFVTFEIVNGKAGYVYVKGSSGGNLYDYTPAGAEWDGALHAPANASGKYADVSHVSFCLCYEPDATCWKGETAWAAGHRYVSRGNWATYTAYVPDGTVTLFAGQAMNAGTVHFAPVGGNVVAITITLNPHWRFADGPGVENVKIQDYAAAPDATNPNPGGFTWKFYATESPFTAYVPLNNFYGVHVDVERAIPCQ